MQVYQFKYASLEWQWKKKQTLFWPKELALLGKFFYLSYVVIPPSSQKKKNNHFLIEKLYSTHKWKYPVKTKPWVHSFKRFIL